MTSTPLYMLDTRPQPAVSSAPQATTQPDADQTAAPLTESAPDAYGAVSLALGLIPIIPIAASILAIVYGCQSYKAARLTGRKRSGMATAGVVLGWIWLVIPVLALVASAVVLARTGQYPFGR